MFTLQAGKQHGVLPDVAGTLGSKTSNGGMRTTDLDGHGAYVPEVTVDWPAEIAGTLDIHYGDKMGMEDQHLYSQRGSRFVPAPSPAVGWLPQRVRIHDADGIAPTLASEEGRGHGVPTIAFAQNTRDEVRLQGGDGQIVGALASEPGMKQTTYVAQPAIGWSEELTAHHELAGTMQYGGQGGRHDGVMTPAMQVRRLTPRECERLQGFPDDYTLNPYRGKPAADGPRYKALGNSMAVPLMHWIGQRIAQVQAMP